MSGEQTWDNAYASYIEPDPDIPGFFRFYSNDRRFPISLSSPFGNWFYDFNHAESLHLTFPGNGLFVRLEPLDLIAKRNNALGNDAQRVIQGKEDYRWYKENRLKAMKATKAISNYWMKGKILIGGGLPANRIVIKQDGSEGEWVIIGNSNLVWTIGHMPPETLTGQTFTKILSSVRFLKEEFFQSQQHAFKYAQ